MIPDGAYAGNEKYKASSTNKIADIEHGILPCFFAEEGEVVDKEFTDAKAKLNNYACYNDYDDEDYDVEYDDDY